MESNLRPLSLGEILDRTAQLYRTNFVLFAGIFSVFCGVSLVLNLLLLGMGLFVKSMHLPFPALWITGTASAIELLILFLLLGAAVAAISRAVAWVHLGQPATIRGAYLSILPRLCSYLWLMTITAFVVYTPIALLYGGYFSFIAFSTGIFGKSLALQHGAAQHAALVNPQTAGMVFAGSLIFFLLLIPAAIYTVMMSLRYALALPASVVENLKARQALRRSVELSQGSRGRIFVLGLLIGAIKIGLVMVTQVFILVAAFQHRGQLGPGLTALSQVIAFFTNTFLGPIYAAGVTLFYYDQRVRKEGYDIEWMMQAAGLTPPAPEAGPGLPVLPLQPHAAGAEPQQSGETV